LNLALRRADQISDLKAENRRLQEHAEDLRSKVAADPAAAERISELAPFVFETHPMLIDFQAILTAGDPNNSIYSSSSLTSKSADAPEGRGRNGGDLGSHAPPHSNSALPDDEPEEGPKKKKVRTLPFPVLNSVDWQGLKQLKKVHGSEKYVCVTCGRTDSPEWRKVRQGLRAVSVKRLKLMLPQGPLGPKTLCNACGLRWAKQVKKTEETVETPSKDAGNDAQATRKTPTP
jgi:GATA zinc finger